MKYQELKSFLKNQLEVRPYLHGIPYWTAAAIVGVWAVLYSGAFNWAISVAESIYFRNPYILFVTSPLCFVLATWVVEKYAPTAGGTGIPHVTHALELKPEADAKEIDSYLRLKVAAVIATSSLLCMIGAGSLGREGPMVHMSACIFYVVGRQFSRVWPYAEHRSWIIAGGAAGIAAAFNAPLAGVIFVLEELAHQHFHQFKSYVISAAIVGGMVSQFLSGKYLYFGYPRIGSVPFSSVPWALLVGMACGLMAWPFHALLAIQWREKLKNYFKTRLAFAFFTGVCMAAIAIFVHPWSMGGGTVVIEKLLFRGELASWSAIAARFFGTIISHLSGCAGGFLAPSLALGASIGSKLAVLVSYSDPALMVLVGMSAFLSAIIGAPFTAWVIVMEMTDRHQAIFPLMVASLVGHGTIQFLRATFPSRHPRK